MTKLPISVRDDFSKGGRPDNAVLRVDDGLISGLLAVMMGA
jgi:hypothetical protein